MKRKVLNFSHLTTADLKQIKNIAMGLIREPLDVDFVVDPRPLTQEEKETINNYFRDYKAKHADKKKKGRDPKGNVIGGK